MFIASCFSLNCCFLHNYLNAVHDGNFKWMAALKFRGQILALTDAESVKKPKLPKKKLLKNSIKRKSHR